MAFKTAIGLKTRFYLIIFCGLFASAVIAAMVNAYLFQKERYHLIDDQLERDLSLLLSSAMQRDDLKDLREAEELFTDVFGEDDLTHFFIIYDSDGSLLYQSESSLRLPLDVILSREPHATYNYERHVVRTLYREVPKRGLEIMVGVFLDREALQWKYRIEQAVLASLVMLVILFCLGYFLNRLILGPMGRISEFLGYWVRHFESRDMPNVETIKNQLVNRYRSTIFKTDEFSALLDSVYDLIHTVSVAWRKQKQFNAIFAHELKTPLTVLSNTLQTLENEPNPEGMREANRQVRRLAEFVDNFLGLLRLRTDPNRQISMQAIDVPLLLEEIIGELAKVYTHSVKLEGASTRFVVAAEPTLARQLFENILTNAMKYSSPDKEIFVRIKPGQIEISDRGSGISPDILSRLGEPFNRGEESATSRRKGHGLGLSWVMSILELLQWRHHLVTGPNGTTWILIPT